MAGPRLAWSLVLFLGLLCIWQQLRWHLREPFELSGLSHAVGIPANVPLTAGFAVRNRTNLPLIVEELDMVGDRARGPSGEITDTVRLDVLEIMVLRDVADGHAVEALPGTPRQRRLAGGPAAGQRVEPDTSLEIAALLVGTGPATFELGPIRVTWRAGPFRGVTDVDLPRGYRVRVTGPDD